MIILINLYVLYIETVIRSFEKYSLNSNKQFELIFITIMDAIQYILAENELSVKIIDNEIDQNETYDKYTHESSNQANYFLDYVQ